jgi:hypothetical protein
LLSLEEAWLGRGEPNKILTGCIIVYVSERSRCDVEFWVFWTWETEIRGAGGVLTNLSNLRIAVVKELHQLEGKSVSKSKDLVAKIYVVYLF